MKVTKLLSWVIIIIIRMMFVPNGGVIWWVTFILGEKKILPTEWL